MNTRPGGCGLPARDRLTLTAAAGVVIARRQRVRA